MTYRALTDATRETINVALLCTAMDSHSVNKRLVPLDGEIDPPIVVKSSVALKSQLDRLFAASSNANLTHLHSYGDMIGQTFLLPIKEDREIHLECVVEAIEMHKHYAATSRQHIQFPVSVNEGQYEEVMAYNDIMQHIARDQDESVVWKYTQLSAHDGPLKQSDPNWKGSSYNMMTNRKNGEISFEPLHIIAADDPVPCATYACENDLLDLRGWKRFKKIAMKQQNLFYKANQGNLRS